MAEQAQIASQTEERWVPRPAHGRAPHREAAFFYGLFLRGHSADELRRTIAVPRDVLRSWEKHWLREPLIRERYEEMLAYRREVLAIFDTLLDQDSTLSRLKQ